VAILEILDLAFGPDGRVDCEAIVEDMVITRYQTLHDPEEYGPALCRGSFYLCEEDVIPATDEGVKRLFENRIDNWTVVDTSDFADDGTDDS